MPLFTSVFIPMLILIMAFYAISVSSFSRFAEEQYQQDTNKTLKSAVHYAQLTLSHIWNTQERPTSLHTASKREYIKSKVSPTVSRLPFSPTSGMMIVDADSKMVLATYPADARALRFDDIQHNLANKTGSIHDFQLPDGDGYTVATYFAPLSVHIIAYDRLNFASSPLYESVKTWGYRIMPSTAFILALLLILICLKTFVNPMKKLVKQLSGTIQADNFNTQVPLEGSAEVQMLTEQINTLLTFLRRRDEKLAEHAEYLEEQVQERTKDLKLAQGQLVQHERLAAVGEFASSIAHELRNPLASIKIGVEKLEKLAELENDKKRTELVKKEILRLENMLTGILSFTANRPNTIDVMPAKRLIEQAAPSIESFTHEKNIKLNIIGKDSARHVSADKNKTLQAILNLTKNACDAAPPESTLTITLHETPKDFCIDIHNEGDPIPNEIVNRLFEPFYTTKPGGTGLGLPTTKRILEEMGGNITLRTEHNYGTCFTIHLPLA